MFKNASGKVLAVKRGVRLLSDTSKVRLVTYSASNWLTRSAQRRLRLYRLGFPASAGQIGVC